MLNYIIVNPFYSGEESSGSGIDVYSRKLYEKIASKENVNAYLLNLSYKDNRRAIKKNIARILSDFNDASTILEVPDARAFGELIPPKYFMHIRLHCPLFLAQYYDNQKPGYWTRFREIRQIRKANYLSAPSLLMKSELSSILIDRDISVFPNPPVKPYKIDADATFNKKDIDVLFLGRYQHLKGIDIFLNLVNKLGKELSIVVAGDNRDIKIDAASNLRNYRFVDPEQKSKLLARSKCVLVPSRFESFSMVAYEALIHKVKVVVWPRTGFREWVDEKVVFLASNNENETLKTIFSILNDTPRLEDFSSKVKEMESKFWCGIEEVCREFYRWVGR